MNVPPHHPLQELLAQLLFSIETLPPAEQRRMVNSACKAAAKWHEKTLQEYRDYRDECDLDEMP